MLATAMEGWRRSMQVQSKQQQRLEEVLDKLLFFLLPLRVSNHRKARAQNAFQQYRMANAYIFSEFSKEILNSANFCVRGKF